MAGRFSVLANPVMSRYRRLVSGPDTSKIIRKMRSEYGPVLLKFESGRESRSCCCGWEYKVDAQANCTSALEPLISGHHGTEPLAG
ncbi:hypothetical protein J6590_017889 [Homalodisca vitripennis]|nr:hypothetical protein J6590_017889 [Homalodisca vitripennis]